MSEENPFEGLKSFICPICQATVYIPISTKSAKYCSQECLGKSMLNKPGRNHKQAITPDDYVKIPCAFHGCKDFAVLKPNQYRYQYKQAILKGLPTNPMIKYCSDECSYKSRRKEIKKEVVVQVEKEKEVSVRRNIWSLGNSNSNSDGF